MEFSKSFSDILKSIEEIFNNADLPTCKMYRDSPEWDNFRLYLSTNKKGALHYGLTKFVLNLEVNDNFVVKIPFSGSYYAYISEKDERYSDYYVNHCKRELEDYNDLKDSEIGFLLLPTYYVGKVGELEIYAQPKVIPYNYDVHSASRESYRIASELEYYECTADDEDTIAAFVEAFGDEAEHILCMLDNYDIRDIHTGNFGYQDNKLVLFDYCGYHS